MHTHIQCTCTSLQLFSIIVFGCVADQVYQSNNGARVCFYDFSNACSFAIAVGVIAFLLCLTFLVKDVLFVIIDYSDTMVVSYLPVHQYSTFSEKKTLRNGGRSIRRHALDLINNISMGFIWKIMDVGCLTIIYV